jgi:NAD(P)-dependent dehydrogenase (short-subunit alcohol dehydrogenase family)
MTEMGTVIVTGGASGLGAAVAQAVEQAGGTPVVLDLQEPQNGFERELVDLSDGRAAERAVREVAERHGGLDAVVTAAGVDACGPIEKIEPERWERVIAVNLLGTAAVVRAALPYLERSRGRIVTVASTLGLRGAGDATAYCASKFGVVGFTQALAAELQDRVGVTMLVPGGMATSFFDGREEKYMPPPDFKLAPPEDVAASVIFALSAPRGAEVRELLVAPATETSWP